VAPFATKATEHLPRLAFSGNALKQDARFSFLTTCMQEIFLTGRSYGGYLTLQAAGRRPDLWAGGMGVVAIADWALMCKQSSNSEPPFLAWDRLRSVT
jgi:pimeloyl-ACP methyl ester carboxylesterase